MNRKKVRHVTLDFIYNWLCHVPTSLPGKTCPPQLGNRTIK
ncbi:hypothetical protein [Nostoc sp.]